MAVCVNLTSTIKCFGVCASSRMLACDATNHWLFVHSEVFASLLKL